MTILKQALLLAALLGVGTCTILYDYGPPDAYLPIDRIDHHSGPLLPTRTFNFYGKPVSEIYVNQHALMSFDAPSNDYQPSAFPLHVERLVSLFWNDHGATGHYIYYRQTTDPAILAQATADVAAYFPCETNFNATWVFVATWDEVYPYPYQGTHSNCYSDSYTYYSYGGYGGYGGCDEVDSPNTYQIVLISDGFRSFIFFNYDTIGWAKYAHADYRDYSLIGLNRGDGWLHRTHPASFTADTADMTTMSNVGVPGRFVYRVDKKYITADPCKSTCPCDN